MVAGEVTRLCLLIPEVEDEDEEEAKVVRQDMPADNQANLPAVEATMAHAFSRTRIEEVGQEVEMVSGEGVVVAPSLQ